MDLRKLFAIVSRERKKEPNPFEEVPDAATLKEKMLTQDSKEKEQESREQYLK